MVLQFPLEKEPNYVTDCLVCDEELDDPKDNSVGHVVFEELKKIRPTEKPKAKLKTLFRAQPVVPHHLSDHNLLIHT